MGVRFTGPDLVALALEIERNGAAFYEACLSRDNGERASRVFRFMLGEERKHVQQFQELESLLKGIENLGKPMSDEEQQYLTALATSNIFTAEGTGEEMAEMAEDAEEALELAMQFEKDSVLFYSEFLNFVTEAARPVVEEILRQEKVHISQLAELRAFLES